MNKEQLEEEKGGSPTPSEGRKEGTSFCVGPLPRGTPRAPLVLMGLPFNAAQPCRDGAA